MGSNAPTGTLLEIGVGWEAAEAVELVGRLGGEAVDVAGVMRSDSCSTPVS